VHKNKQNILAFHLYDIKLIIMRLVLYFNDKMKLNIDLLHNSLCLESYTKSIPIKENEPSVYYNVDLIIYVSSKMLCIHAIDYV